LALLPLLRHYCAAMPPLIFRRHYFDADAAMLPLIIFCRFATPLFFFADAAMPIRY